MDKNNDKPFIHTYHSPRGFYFYEVNKDTIVSVSENIYKYLNNSIEYDHLGDEDREYTLKLKENGYLSSKHMTEIRHPDMDNLESSLATNCTQLLLQVTQSCNLICSYCPYACKVDDKLQRSHSGKTMKWETAKKAIDFFAEHSAKRDDLVFSFYGGEPIIAFELIKKCVSYIEEVFLGKNYSFNMTSNGTLMTDEVINYLIEKDFDICISLDGPASIHDINRKRTDGTGSFSSAFSTLKKFAERYGKECRRHLSMNMVMDTDNDLEEVISLFDDEFFKKYDIGITATIADDRHLNEKKKMSEDFLKKFRYSYFIGFLSEFGIIDDLEVPIFVRNHIKDIRRKYSEYKCGNGELPDVGAPGGPCIPGQRRLFINVDGNFYPCERVSEISECTKIGSLDSGFDLKKASAFLNVASTTAKKCKNCYAVQHCTLCAQASDTGTELSAEKRMSNCRKVQHNFDSEIMDCILIKEIRTLYKWRNQK